MDRIRLEAFCDGVTAVIITITVLQLKVPQHPTWQSHLAEYPVFGSYALSFVFVGLYWSCHHHKTSQNTLAVHASNGSGRW